MEAVSYRFSTGKLANLKTAQGTRLDSIEIREVCASDEFLAAQRSKAKKDTTVADELTRLSITRVNDVKVDQPFEEFDRWTYRTRLFVAACFNKVNGISEDETDDFLGVLKAGMPSENA